MTADSTLSTALVVIYATLSLPTIYVAVKHGFKTIAVLGWAYVFIFCTLRVIGAAMTLSNPKSTGAAIVGNIGLSPLLLAAGGILHEATIHNRLTNPNPNDEPPSKLPTILIFILHLLVTSGIAIVAFGASKLVSSSSSTTPASITSAYNLATAGTAILFLSWIGVTLVSVILAAKMRSGPKGSAARRLAVAVLIAAPFLGVRVTASLVSFAGRIGGLSVVGGELGLRIGLMFVEELIVVLLFLVVGFVTAGPGRGGRKRLASLGGSGREDVNMMRVRR